MIQTIRNGGKFHIYCAHISHIIFTVKDDDLIGATLIGRVYILVEEIIKGFVVDRWVEILDEGYNPIHVFWCCRRFSMVPDSLGIRNPKYEGVPRTFLNQRQGCRVTLYQDSDRCWEDIFDAITNVRQFIYITGWSVYTEITLIRDPRRRKDDITLGQLLKKKANEGVLVLLLVWDDRTSVEEIKKDEEYFRNTKVRCFLCPRNPDERKNEIVTMFTHHQKTVVVDNEISGGGSQRRIVSFITGIDLFDGRYDTKKIPWSHGMIFIANWKVRLLEISCTTLNRGGKNRLEKCTFLIPLGKLEEITVQPLQNMFSNDNKSWNNAYIYVIRRATNFIYIENQYFLGRAFGEDFSKIEVGKRFIVYIVVPKWPEGIPESASVRAILDWQRRTVEMMYTDIFEALQRKASNMEMDDEYKPLETPEPNTDYKRSQQARRFMILHALKNDDRSMDEARDSEIAIGAFQLNHLASTIPYDHLKVDDNSFWHLESLECIRRVNQIAEKNWEFYSSDTCYQDLPGHLLHYPIKVSKNRALTTLPGFEYFPNTKARVSAPNPSTFIQSSPPSCCVYSESLVCG
ncbi:phospholipase D alpha 1-like [Pyrus ussuriensis x Pyrus communis]|uniref:phospholipase D n=1 Tax=Pyrus ussuriensis x Pyrus communis TaxID=2448454 RepID=A0A5N5HR48_9ROSA|nr:phospholipase D alpha 1-like [Pyrus ussuriensis x Pyrus communis]